jgi:multicomponent Na+:H+ antiporter subunit C
MNAVLAVVVGGLFAAGLYLMLRRSLIRVVMGLLLMGQAGNLLVFTAGGVARAAPPLVPEGVTGGAAAAATGELARTGLLADPLPQALVLTAIVINFAMLAFALVLAHIAQVEVGTDDLREFREHRP